MAPPTRANGVQVERGACRGEVLRNRLFSGMRILWRPVKLQYQCYLYVQNTHNTEHTTQHNPQFIALLGSLGRKSATSAAGRRRPRDRRSQARRGAPGGALGPLLPGPMARWQEAESAVESWGASRWARPGEI